MKNKLKGVLGVGLTLVMVVALTAGFYLPVGASPDENEWSTFDYPLEGEDGGWFYDPGIDGITAIDLAVNGDLYAYVDGLDNVFVSTDGGRSWAETDYVADTAGGDVIDIACSSIDEDIVYVTDGDLVYKSEDAGDTWAAVAETSLTNAIDALPGDNQAITSLAVGYDRNDDPLVFVGTEDATTATYEGGVLYIAEAAYPSVWTDLDFDAYNDPNTYDVASIGVSPDFAIDDMLLAVVTTHGATLVGEGAAEAEWSTAHQKSGSYSAKLTVYKETMGYQTGAQVAFDIEPITAAELPPVSFSVYAPTDDDLIWAGGVVASPYFQFTVDLHGTTPAGATHASIVSGNPTMITPEIGKWDTMTIALDGQWLVWDWKGELVASGATLEELHGALVAEYPNYEVTRVSVQHGFRLPGDMTADTATVYIDDIIINGRTYDLEGDTDVVSNTGVVGDWTKVSDLVSSVITGASDICFPDDYDDTETVFIGIEDEADFGDVYNVTDTALDLDINGTTETDVVGLDILGETDDATLVAGASASTNVFYSTDGGWDWDVTDKVPSGVDTTLIVLSGDSVFAATSGTECGLSLSVNEGELFNQISLIATDIDEVTGVALSPAYAEDETMFMLTRDTTGHTDSLLRYDGENWERVAETGVLEWVIDDTVGAIGIVAISPDYPTDNTVFLGDDTPQMFYSNDAGNEWAGMRYPPANAITTWLIIDGDTILVGGYDDDAEAGVLQMTTRSGSRPWEDAEVVADSADAITSIAKSGDQLLVGDNLSQVFISPDGELDEFEQVDTDPIGPAGNTFVGFGSDILYATSGDVVARCVIDPDEDWADQTWEEIATPEVTGPTTVTTPADAFTMKCTALTTEAVLGFTGEGTVTLTGGPTGAQFEWTASANVTDPNNEVNTPGDIYIAEGETATFASSAASPVTIVTLNSGSVTIVTGVNTTTDQPAISRVVIVHGTSGAYSIAVTETGDVDTTVTGMPPYYCAVNFGDVGDAVTFTAGGAVTPVLGSIDSVTLGGPAVTNTLVDKDGDASVTETIHQGGSGTFSLPDVEEVIEVEEEVTTHGLQVASGLVALPGTALYVTDNTAGVGLWRSLNPYEEDVDDVVFEMVGTELELDDTAKLALWGFTVGSYVVWAPEFPATENLWTYEDTLNTEVILKSPVDGMSVDETDEATLEWFELTGAEEYEIAVNTSEGFEADTAIDVSDVSPTEKTSVTVSGLDSGTTYYWKVRVASGEPLLSRWSEVRSFVTELVPVAVGPIWVPEIGATDVSLTPTFMWTEVEGATSYKIIVATEPDFAVTSRIAEEMIITNSYVCHAKLSYSTTYYWRVKAFSDSVVVSEWTSGMFTTMAKPVPPTPPVEITPAPPAPEIEVEVPPPQVIEVPPAQVISPTWIYVIIGVGALLVIAVIILIVRTRRVS